MHGKKLKKKSKRISLGMKYKIQKKVRDHHKKLKKEMKKNPSKFGKRNKAVGVPNSCPFKADIIHETRIAKEEEEEKRKQRKHELKIRRKDEKGSLGSSVGEYIEKVENQNKEFQFTENLKNSKKTEFTDKSAKVFYKEFRKVVEAADVILEILDARDPLGTRCKPVEDLVTSNGGKRLVLVLNKADLVPKSNLEAWVQYLKKEHPTILFKASTQQQNRGLSHLKSKFKNIHAYKGVGVSQCVGAENLMQLLKNYCRNAGIKTSILVGVVGLPNVGKSSLINSLKRSKACNVGATPGITKALQSVTIDSKINLLDSPGLILPSNENSDVAFALRNAISIDSIDDLVTPVEAILNRAGKRYMTLLYGISDYKDTTGFLYLLAMKTGKLMKGGVANPQAAAKMVLNDWNTGKIKYHTCPPEKTVSEITETSTAIVSNFSEEFDIPELDSGFGALLKALPDVVPAKTVLVQSLQPVHSVLEGDYVGAGGKTKKNVSFAQNVEMESGEDNESGEEMEVEENKSDLESEKLLDNVKIDKFEKTPIPETENKKPRWETKPKEFDLSKTCLKKIQKSQAKKLRKEKNRNEKSAAVLTQCLENFGGINDNNNENLNSNNDDYNFNDYFNK